MGKAPHFYTLNQPAMHQQTILKHTAAAIPGTRTLRFDCEGVTAIINQRGQTFVAQFITNGFDYSNDLLEDLTFATIDECRNYLALRVESFLESAYEREHDL